MDLLPSVTGDLYICIRPWACSSLRYWVIHSITLPSLFLAGWLFVSTAEEFEFESLVVLCVCVGRHEVVGVVSYFTVHLSSNRLGVTSTIPLLAKNAHG